MKSKKNTQVREKNLMFIIDKLNNGGAERVISNLSNYYCSKNGNSKIVIVVGDKKKSDYNANAKIIEVSEFRSFKKWPIAIWKIRRLKKKYKIDTSISFLISGNILNYYSKANDKVIISNRNYMSLSFLSRIKKWEKDREKVKIHRRIEKRADLVVNCSKAVEYDEIHNNEMDPNKMVTIPNFVDIENLQRLAEEPIGDKIKHLFDENTLLVIGRYNVQKGVPNIIKAFSEVQKTNKEAKLVILGRGELKEYYEKLIEKYHLKDSVFLLDFDPNPYKYMKKSGMLVLNSVHEGMPNIVLEAMALELPVIGSDCFGGTSEILDGDFSPVRIEKMKFAKYGILVPPPIFDETFDEDKLTNNEIELKKAIITLLNDKKLYNHYKKMSKERVEDYRRDKIIEKWNEII